MIRATKILLLLIVAFKSSQASTGDPPNELLEKLVNYPIYFSGDEMALGKFAEEWTEEFPLLQDETPALRQVRAVADIIFAPREADHQKLFRLPPDVQKFLAVSGDQTISYTELKSNSRLAEHLSNFNNGLNKTLDPKLFLRLSKLEHQLVRYEELRGTWLLDDSEAPYNELLFSKLEEYSTYKQNYQDYLEGLSAKLPENHEKWRTLLQQLDRKLKLVPSTEEDEIVWLNLKSVFTKVGEHELIDPIPIILADFTTAYQAGNWAQAYELMDKLLENEEIQKASGRAQSSDSAISPLPEFFRLLGGMILLFLGYLSFDAIRRKTHLKPTRIRPFVFLGWLLCFADTETMANPLIFLTPWGISAVSVLVLLVIPVQAKEASRVMMICTISILVSLLPNETLRFSFESLNQVYPRGLLFTLWIAGSSLTLLVLLNLIFAVETWFRKLPLSSHSNYLKSILISTTLSLILLLVCTTLFSINLNNFSPILIVLIGWIVFSKLLAIPSITRLYLSNITEVFMVVGMIFLTIESVRLVFGSFLPVSSYEFQFKPSVYTLISIVLSFCAILRIGSIVNLSKTTLPHRES